jgi:diguanylate cyclase (GGDEF)-like protein
MLRAALLAFAVGASAPVAGAEDTLRVLAANTLVETGVMEALVAQFQTQRPGVRVEVAGAGALAVLERGREGKADLLITHYPQGEELFVHDGYGASRTLVLYNDFAFLGPAPDPLGISRGHDPVVALKRLAAGQADFFVPSARSGTARRLNQLFAIAQVESGWVGYQVTETSAKGTLQAAAMAGAYTFADMGTYLVNRAEIGKALVPLLRDHILLRNNYRAIVVNQAKVAHANQALAQAFHDFLVSDPAQALIGRYGEDRYGVQMLTPAAHLDEGLRAMRMQAALEGRQRDIMLLGVLAAVLAISLGTALWLLRRVRRVNRLRLVSEERFSLAVSGSNDGIWDWNIMEGTGYISARMRAILGLPTGPETIERPLDLMLARLSGETRRELESLLDRSLRGDLADGVMVKELHMESDTGEPAWVLVRGRVQYDASGRATRLSGTVTDITDRRRQTAAMEHQSLHDALTGLPNRTLLKRRLDDALHAVAQSNHRLAVVMMDLDRFKEINDTLGHHIGDQLLQQVCRRIEETVRTSDTVARFGGDEFAIVLPGADESGARRVAEKILAGLNRLFDLGSHQLYVGGSFGIALYPQHGEDATTLVQHADVAMYHAKRGALGAAVYDAQYDRNSVVRLDLEKDLREAIAGDTLSLHYQPKINLRDGRMVGVEALLRWQHPTKGPISPAMLVPIAEETGLIKSLTLWVVSSALRQCAAWRSAGMPLPVAVNLSAWNLQDPALVDYIRDALTAANVPASALELEITESAMMADPEHSLVTLEALAAMDVHLSIDDYGTGFSSLAYLHRLPVDTLKIDRSFISDLLENRDNMSIVRSTIELAHNLGLSVVAEGVETAAVSAELAAMGCDTAQGYLFSRPRPADEIDELWRDLCPSNIVVTLGARS